VQLIEHMIYIFLAIQSHSNRSTMNYPISTLQNHMNPAFMTNMFCLYDKYIAVYYAYYISYWFNSSQLVTN